MKTIRVGLIGASSCPEDIYKAAYAVGREIAKRKAVLICGGLGGVMEAGAQGAAEKGGITVGILPGENEQQGNRYLTIAVPTGMGHARNVLIVRASHSVIAVSGGYGTLSEIALALKMKKRVVGLHTWRDIPGIIHAATPEEAVEKALEPLIDN